MRHLFIINPAAGKKESTAELEGLLAQLSVPHTVVYTNGAGDAQRLTRQAAMESEPLRVYACGGDGTLNEVVNGAAGFSHVAVTNVPKGTGNDFLKIFGPDYRTQFYDLEALAVGPQSAFDLMDCNGKLGIDVVCAGVDARIAAGVHRYKDLRFVSGMGAYTLSLLENIFFKGINRPMTVQMGELSWQNRQTAILCICNGRYYGGGFMPVAEAMPDDGSPAIVVRAEEGMYVNVDVSEMSLDTVKVGGTIYCNSWETGEQYEAEIVEISPYPSSGSTDAYSYDGLSNPNSSYYPVVAYSAEADGLVTGESVEVSYNPQSMGTTPEDAIFLQKAYVRTDDSGRSYVYKEGKDHRLEKQYVETGTVLYGQYVEILSGVTMDDNLAFPYGKDVKEGAKTELSENTENIIY